MCQFMVRVPSCLILLFDTCQNNEIEIKILRNEKKKGIRNKNNERTVEGNKSNERQFFWHV